MTYESKSAKDLIHNRGSGSSSGGLSKEKRRTWFMIIASIAAFVIIVGPAIISLIFVALGLGPIREGEVFPLFAWGDLLSHPFGATAPIILFSAGMIWFLKSSASGSSQNGTIRFAQTSEYGNARLATDEEFNAAYPSYIRSKTPSWRDILEKDPNAQPIDGNGTTNIAKGGMVIDSRLTPDGKDVIVTYNPRQIQHVVIGSVGSGKTTGFIGTSILSIANAGDSMIINDPKGELYKIYANWLKAQGYEVHLLNYEKPSAGQMYNQLQFINDVLDEAMPHLYNKKAIDIMLKYIGYFTYVGTDREDILDRDEFNIYALGSANMQAGFADTTGGAPDFQMFTSDTLKTEFKRLISRNKNFGNYQEADILIATFKIWFTKLFKQTYDDFVKANRPIRPIFNKKNEPKYEPIQDYVENNEYLHYRQEQVIKAALNVLRTCNKKRMLMYFDEKRISLEKFLGEASPESITYQTISQEYKELVDVMEDIKASPKLKTSHLAYYLSEIGTIEEKLYKEYEQEAITSSKSIAGMIVESNLQGGSRGEAIWTETPKSLLTSIILFACRESHIPNSRHLGSVYRILAEMFPEVDMGEKSFKSSTKGTWDYVLAAMESIDAVRDTQKATEVAGDKTRASILVSTIMPMGLFSDEAVISQSSQSSLDVLGLVKKPTVIFMNTPGKDNQGLAVYVILASLFVEQSYSTLQRYAKTRPGSTLERSVYFLLDEFGNMPPIPNMGAKISMARAYSMKFQMVIQSYQQFDDNYRNDKETINSNSNTMYLLTSDLATAEAISKRIGKATLEETKESESYGAEHKNTSVSTRTFGVDLYTPQDLMDESFVAGTGVYIAPRSNAKTVQLLPFFKYPDIFKELGPQRTDLATARPNTKIARFCPHDDYKSFIYAYQSLSNASLLDMPLRYVIEKDLKEQNK